MKIIIISVLFFMAAAVKAQSSSAIEVSNRIAQKMKDSLNLTPPQHDGIKKVNLFIHNQKMQVRSRYAGSDSLRFFLQAVENRRDSLYQEVLPTAKYSLYKKKKPVLVRNN